MINTFKWIIFDQAKVQTHNVFSTVETCSINGKDFSARELEKIYSLDNYKEYMIGHITEESEGANLVTAAGSAIPLEAQGWNHGK